MKRLALLMQCVFLAAFMGCSEEDDFFVPDEQDDLVTETGGKADTGYMSTLATELEGEYVGSLALDVTEKTTEERDTLVGNFKSGAWSAKNIIMDQVKYAKNKINSEALHMNLYSNEIEVESAELVGDRIVVQYRASLESIVSNEELEEAGRTVEEVIGSITTVRTPADPTDLFDRIGDKCAEGFDEGDLANYNYFYYFKPDKEGCDIELSEASFTVASLAPPETTYPEYDRLGADGKVTVMVIFGAAGHEEEVDSWDWGMREWRDFKRYMQSRDFEKISDLEPGERFQRIKNGIEETIDILCPTDIYHNPESDNLFKQGIAEHELVLYNGHSFYGSLSVLKDCSVYPDDTYQIFHMGSCWSYEYYTSQVFECRKSDTDPHGWDLADVVNDTESGWFHNNAEFSRILLTNIFAGVETGGKDGDRYYTWFNIISAMNKHAIDTWKSWGTETHEIMGVSGVKNNQYDPEAGGNGSEGKKYESDAAVDIPDDDPAGVDSEITVADSIVPSRITVAVDISHDYIGDLTVTLKRNGVDVVLHDQEGGWEDNIIREYEVTDAGLLGQEAQGSWVLHLTDTSAMDQGTLNSWSITLVP